MKVRMGFAIILVFGLIGAVRMGSADDLFFMHVNVKNEGQTDLDDLKVNVFFYDLGIVLQTNPFDLDDNDKTGKLIFWDKGNIEPGDYLARITVSNDDVKEVKHRIITIA